MTPAEKLDLDVKDWWRVYRGIEAYAVDAKEAFERLRVHKEDAFCELTSYDGIGKTMCTRDGYDAIFDLAERHRESLPVPDDYSAKELAEAIRARFVRVMCEEKNDEAALARVLAEAEADAKAKHFPQTFHFPCVVVRRENRANPAMFFIGPVVFTAAKSFMERFSAEIAEYIANAHDKEWAEKRVKRFEEYTAQLGWIATVEVPPCSAESGKRRAEVAVTTAINILRLIFGVGYGGDMRLAHTGHAKASHTEYAFTKHGKFDLIHSWSGSGAFVDGDWFAQLSRPQWRGFWQRAGHLLDTTVAGRRSEIAERVIDALRWFGEAAFEFSPGTQVINLVAALERLTTTEWFTTHKFCSRVALLAAESDDTFEKCYWHAYELHSARSAIMHGAFSPTTAKFRKVLDIAHDVTQSALYHALEIHCHLDDSGRLSKIEDLQNLFTSMYSKKADVLGRLKTACKQREEMERKQRC